MHRPESPRFERTEFRKEHILVKNRLACVLTDDWVTVSVSAVPEKNL